MEYQAIYKCRLCGETIIGNSNKVTAFMNVNHYVGNQESDDLVKAKELVHICRNDSIGILDFLGYKSPPTVEVSCVGAEKLIKDLKDIQKKIDELHENFQ